MSFKRTLMGATAAIMMITTAGFAQADVLFWSTQAKPVEETQNMREQVLAGAGQAVDYQANDGGPWLTRLKAEIEAGTGTIGVLGALHGDFAAMNADEMVDLSGIDLGGVELNATFAALGKLETEQQLYLPWMQASYIMAANKKALEFLPEGADIDALSYDQLIAWTANIETATGDKKFGFPAGPKGFFKGICIRPSPMAWSVPSNLTLPSRLGKPSVPCGAIPTPARPISASCKNSFCLKKSGSHLTTLRGLPMRSTNARMIL
jgi:multiple sugar transport system substrate-binding protein